MLSQQLGMAERAAGSLGPLPVYRRLAASIIRPCCINALSSGLIIDTLQLQERGQQRLTLAAAKRIHERERERAKHAQPRIQN